VWRRGGVEIARYETIRNSETSAKKARFWRNGERVFAGLGTPDILQRHCIGPSGRFPLPPRHESPHPPNEGGFFPFCWTRARPRLPLPLFAMCGTFWSVKSSGDARTVHNNRFAKLI